MHEDAQIVDPHDSVRDEAGAIAEAFRAAVQYAIGERDVDRLKELTGGLHEADMGDLLEALDGDERRRLIELLGSAFDFTALTELDETMRVQILHALSPGLVAKGISALDFG